MVARALIVLLLVLNVGVASWWALSPTPALPGPAAPDAMPPLQLLDEVPARRRSTAPAAQRAVSPPSIAPPRCWRLGPFTDAATLARAQAWLRSRVPLASIASAPGTARGWRVWLPPLSNRVTAQAVAQKIAAAGFNDYYVIPDGGEANGIALGRYGNANAAQRRQAALREAGFDASAEPVGAPPQWIHVAATAAFNPDAARAATGAAQQQPIDCARLQ